MIHILDQFNNFAIGNFTAYNANGDLLWTCKNHNLVTDPGRQFLAAQGYSLSPGSNGLNFLGLSPDTVTETGSSTTLSNEITTNGFARAQGTITLPTSQPATTLSDNPLGSGATTINVGSTSG